MPEMEQKQQQQHSFSRIAEDGKWEFFLDSHMIQTFALCERLFQYTHIEHWRPKGDDNFNLKVGSWWSAVLEKFYEQMAMKELTKQSNVFNAVSLWQQMDMDSLKISAPDKLAKFGGAERSYELGGKLLALPSGAILMADAYYDQYAELDSRQWRILATEAGFGLKREILVGETYCLRVYLTGRPDLVVMDPQGRVMPVDHKTCSEIRSDWDAQWKPHFQMTAYVFAVQSLLQDLGYPNAVVDRCIVNGCCKYESATPRDKKKAPAPRFKRAFPMFSQDEVEEWRQITLRKVHDLYEALGRYGCVDFKDLQQYAFRPAASQTCHQQYYRPCTFCGVCSKPPGARELYLSSNFIEGEPWAPYTVGGGE